jgi:hypothetical protein
MKMNSQIKNRMKHLILLFAWMLLACGGPVQRGTMGELSWTLSGGTLTVSGTGAMPDNKPDSITGAPWFSYRESIRTVVIENGVTTVGAAAFTLCDSLRSVTLPNSVTTIGAAAFVGCTSLASVTLPNSVMEIGHGAFGGCSSLRSVALPNSVTAIGTAAFAACGSLASVVIPSSVTALENYVFQSCSSLTSVTLPQSVTTIGEEAFRWCSSLTTIAIPQSVTTIGDRAFGGCSSLEDVQVGWATPLSVSDPIFEETDIASGTLHVPAGTESLYQSAPVWKDFHTVSGTEAALAVLPAATVCFRDGLLCVNTPPAERIEVYSLRGQRVFGAEKAPGEASFPVPHLPQGVWIVRGSSGWTEKRIGL